jgi:L-ribulose-5-phosphate 4-epimerase
MLDELKEQVLEANVELARRGLVLETFGNASAIDRDRGLVVIKPSGVDYGELAPDDMVVVDLDGGKIEGELAPSSDTPSHVALYRGFDSIGGVAHTHSRYATAWAQARRPIPCLGTTHADYFEGPVPVTRAMLATEIESDYEANTGRVIVETFENLDPLTRPGVLVASHGPFTWGPTAADAVHMAAVLEELAAMAHLAATLAPDGGAISQALLKKHFTRKHGPDAYYGQDKESPG